MRVEDVGRGAAVTVRLVDFVELAVGVAAAGDVGARLADAEGVEAYGGGAEGAEAGADYAGAAFDFGPDGGVDGAPLGGFSAGWSWAWGFGGGDGLQVGSFDLVEAGRETILMMLVATTNQPSRKTAARDTFCVHFSCSRQIAGMGMMMMMRSHIVLNAAYAYHDAPRSKQVPGCRLSQTLWMGSHSKTEAMAKAEDPANTAPARTWAKVFRFHWMNIRR